jgi:polyferredoxin
MENKLLNIVLFLIVTGLTIILTPVIVLLTLLFGSFVLSYFLVTHFYEKWITKRVKENDDDEKL